MDDQSRRAGLSQEALAAADLWEEKDAISQSGPFAVSRKGNYTMGFGPRIISRDKCGYETFWVQKGDVA